MLAAYYNSWPTVQSFYLCGILMRTAWILAVWVVFATAAGQQARGQLADPNTIGGAVDALESQLDGARRGFLNNTEFPGSTLDSPDLEVADPRLCADLCAKDEYCKAWTFRRPRPGVSYRCDLKSEVPTAVTSVCCVSGVKAAAPAGNPQKTCDIDTEKMAGKNVHGQSLCMSYWWAPPGSEDFVRHVHIVNSQWWEEFAWKPPPEWKETIYNECEIVYESELKRCEQMKNAN